MVIYPYRLVWRQIPGSRVYVVYSVPNPYALLHLRYLFQREGVPWLCYNITSPQSRILSLAELLSRVSWVSGIVDTLSSRLV